MNVRIPLDAPVEELSVASQQLVAIARALCHRSTVIIMDEPKSALTRREVRNLFQIVEAGRQRGVTFSLSASYQLLLNRGFHRGFPLQAQGPSSYFVCLFAVSLSSSPYCLIQLMLG